MLAGGVWVVCDDYVSATPIVQRMEYYWRIAKELRPSQVAEVLEQQGQEVGEFLTHPPDQPAELRLVLHEEAILKSARCQFELSPSEQSVMDYVSAVAPFDPDGTERIRILEQYLARWGEFTAGLEFLAQLYLSRSDFDQARRYALQVLGRDRNNMGMVGILIQSESRNNLVYAARIALDYQPEAVAVVEQLEKVAEVLQAYLEQEQDAKLASKLLNVYRRICELRPASERAVRENAAKLCRKYGWKLGW